jgi:hypothetical protein
MNESIQPEPLLPDLLAARLMEMRRQQASALQATEATLLWLGVLPAEGRLLLSREERARFRQWVRETTTNS